jgi:hypothetical protein
VVLALWYRIPQITTVPMIAGWKMRVTTTYNGIDEVVEKKRSF